MKQREDRYFDHEIRIVRLEEAIINIGHTLNRMETRFDRIEARLDRIDERIESLQSSMYSGFKWLITFGIGATTGVFMMLAHGLKWI